MLPMIPETVFPYGTWRKLNSMLISLVTILTRIMFRDVCATQLWWHFDNILLQYYIIKRNYIYNNWKIEEIVKLYKILLLRNIENQKDRRDERKIFTFVKTLIIEVIITSIEWLSIVTRRRVLMKNMMIHVCFRNHCRELSQGSVHIKWNKSFFLEP